MDELQIEADDAIWDPCGVCGSDGFPGDFARRHQAKTIGPHGPGMIITPAEYRCWDCALREIELTGDQEQIDRMLACHDEVMLCRMDPTSLSYRGVASGHAHEDVADLPDIPEVRAAVPVVVGPGWLPVRVRSSGAVQAWAASSVMKRVVLAATLVGAVYAWGRSLYWLAEQAGDMIAAMGRDEDA